MKFRQILTAILIVAPMCHTAAAQPRKSQPKKEMTQMEAPPMEKVVAGTTNPQASTLLSDMAAVKPQMPLGPQDVLKSYEIAMSLVADKTSTDLAIIVQAYQANQITREQAEFLLQQRYQVAMMQYQVLSALHDVLRHDMEEATQQAQPLLRTTRSDTALMVPCPGSNSACK